MVYPVIIVNPAYINYNQNHQIVNVYNNVQKDILVQMVFAQCAQLIVYLVTILITV